MSERILQPRLNFDDCVQVDGTVLRVLIWRRERLSIHTTNRPFTFRIRRGITDQMRGNTDNWADSRTRPPGSVRRPACWTRRRSFLCIAVWIATVLVSASAADLGQADEDDTGLLTAGAARVDVTPDPRMTNWVTHAAYDGVLDPIDVKALVLGQGTERVALLTWDLVDAREGAVARVRADIERELGIPGTHVLVNASHTHSAPWSPVGDAPLLALEHRRIDAVERDPQFAAWSERFFAANLEAVTAANSNRTAVKLFIGRADVGDLVFNRRPIKPDATVETVFEPEDREILPRGLRYASVDPNATVLLFRDADHATVASVFHLACHPVSVYPYHDGISADWPGTVVTRLRERLGGESLFLQGCGGNIVPSGRGLEKRESMGLELAERLEKAANVAHPVDPGPLVSTRAVFGAPLAAHARRETGLEFFPVEIQAIRVGNLALVSLPGEPLIELADRITAESPIGHTLVLGYSNGYGVHYVGVKGEKRKGGYEMGAVGAGADECGDFMIETALRLLAEAAAWTAE